MAIKDVNETAYGRSTSGLNNLKNEFYSYTRSIQSFFGSDPEVQNLLKIINNEWHGTDQENFLNEYKRLQEMTKNQIMKLSSDYSDCLNTDLDNFKKAQGKISF